MSMDLNSLNASDLTDANIGSFLQAFEEALNNEEYSKVKAAIQKVNDFIQTAGIVDVDKDGNNTINITSGSTTETINISMIAKGIKNRVQHDVDNHVVTGTASTERDNAEADMDKFLINIFNQDKLLEELIGRGFSLQKFEEQAQRANDESRAHIDELRNKQGERKEKYKELIGEDSQITAGQYTVKSYPTRIRDCQDAVTSFTVAEKQFNQLDTLKAEKAAETDPSKIAEIDAKIARAENNLKYLARKISDLNVRRVDKSIFNDWEKKDTATAISEIASAKTIAENELDSLYIELKSKVVAMDPDKLSDYGITTEIEDKFIGIDDSDDAIKKSSREGVDKFIQEMRRFIKNGATAEIAREEQLIRLREENVKQYKDMDERIRQVTSKVTVRYTQAIDPNTNTPMVDGEGNPVQVPETRAKIARDSNGNYIVQDGQYQRVQAIDPNTNTPMVDGEGNPIYEQEVVFERVTDDTDRSYYLQKAGYNESQALIDIDKEFESNKAKRAVLKSNNVGNWFTRLFATKRLWKKYNFRDQILSRREDRIIELEERKEYEEVIPMDHKLFNLENLFSRIKRSSAIQHQLYNAGKDQGRNPTSVDKSTLIDALENAAYEEALYVGAEEGRDVIEEYRKKNSSRTDAKGTEIHEDLVKKRVDGIQSDYTDVMHKDVDDDLEL